MFKKFTWGHGIIVALLLFMIFILSLIFFFSRNWQNAEMVSDHYYEDELHYQEVINAKKNAEKLSELPQYSQSTQEIIIKMPNTALPDQGDVAFELFRTDDARFDVKKNLKTDAQHRFIIPGKIMKEGSYTLKVMWKSNGIPYQVDYNMIWTQH